MTLSVFIDGAAGTTGLEIAERLAGRSEFVLIALPDAERKDPAHRAAAMNAADVVILCLPDDAAREAAAMVTNPATRIIDASSAHRTAPGWTYGFPELTAGQADAIRAASRISNPGCYATGFIALIAPLVAASVLDADARLTCSAVSGYSGGGKALIARYAEDPALAFRSYALTLAHKHVPEMQGHSALTHPPLFAPAVVPAFRGMVVEVPLNHAGPIADAARDALTTHYAGQPLVRVHADGPADGELLLRGDARPRDGMDLYVFGNADGTQARLVAVLDNLGKGASGACVQNLNLIAGLPQDAGLTL